MTTGRAVQVEDTSALVKAAANGDEEAWTAIVRRFGRLVWSVTRAHGLDTADAEEVFQTTWLRLAEHIGRLRDPEHVGAWLATTARNQSLKLIRAGTRLTVTDDPHLLDLSVHETPEILAVEAEDAQFRARLAERVWAAFQRLPARCQRLLRVLVATPPLSYAEIAALLDIAVGSIGPTRGRCLDQLRTLLADTP